MDFFLWKWGWEVGKLSYEMKAKLQCSQGKSDSSLDSWYWDVTFDKIFGQTQWHLSILIVTCGDLFFAGIIFEYPAYNSHLFSPTEEITCGDNICVLNCREEYSCSVSIHTNNACSSLQLTFPLISILLYRYSILKDF